MAKEATRSFVLRVDASTMEAVERWAADEFRSTNGQLQWLDEFDGFLSRYLNHLFVEVAA